MQSQAFLPTNPRWPLRFAGLRKRGWSPVVASRQPCPAEHSSPASIKRIYMNCTATARCLSLPRRPAATIIVFVIAIFAAGLKAQAQAEGSGPPRSLRPCTSHTLSACFPNFSATPSAKLCLLAPFASPLKIISTPDHA